MKNKRAIHNKLKVWTITIVSPGLVSYMQSLSYKSLNSRTSHTSNDIIDCTYHVKEDS